MNEKGKRFTMGLMTEKEGDEMNDSTVHTINQMK